MSNSPKRIGDALGRIQAICEKQGGSPIIQSKEISRSDREILLHAGWLEPVTRGWYLLSRPDLPQGDSSAWYAHFWEFLGTYLREFYGNDYCLSPESSLPLRLGIRTIPQQVLVMAKKGRGSPTQLPFDTSLVVYQSSGALPMDRSELWGLQVLELPYALCKVSPRYFGDHKHEIELALAALSPPRELLDTIVRHDFQRAAARIAGSYRDMGAVDISQRLVDQLKDVGILITPTSPFEESESSILGLRTRSPYCARIRSLWERMRSTVIEVMPEELGLPKDSRAYLDSVSAEYVRDAYHSLSIEGYRVTKDLVDKVRNAEWDPEGSPEDAQQRDAMAARGYYEAFQEVKASIERILSGVNPGKVIAEDASVYYSKLFAASVRAGILREHDLFTYRRHQVFIRGSRHTPLPPEAVMDAMDTLFTLLVEEQSAAVRAVLGHFIFVFIHPYMDGNGRVGRFLMNAMLASGGYPWLVIPVEQRKVYFAALETASVDEDIRPFACFVAALMQT